MSRAFAALLVASTLLAACAHGAARRAPSIAYPIATATPLRLAVARLPSVTPTHAPLPSATPTHAPHVVVMATIPPAPPPLLRPVPSAAPTPFVFRPFARRLDLPPPKPRVLAFATLSPVRFVLPDASPRIIDVYLPSSVGVGGQTVTGHVIASSNTASVEVRVAGYARSMEKIGPGEFTITVTVPRLPFFLRHRTYTLEIVAYNTRGDAVSQALPITVR